MIKFPQSGPFGEFQCDQCGSIYNLAFIPLSITLSDEAICSGLQDGYERVAWHTGPHLQIEITIYLRFEMTSNVWLISAA
jgi:hypothetical protein